MERVDPAVVHRAPGCDQRLARHLPPEHPLAFLVGLDAAKDVHLNWLEVQKVDEELK